MKLKREVAKLTDVAGAHRIHYQPLGDKFVLKDEFELPDPEDGLKANRDALLLEKQTLETKFAGLDPEAARAAIKAVAEGKTKELEGKGKYDEALAAVKQTYVTELSGRDTKIEQLTAQMRGQAVESAALNAFVAAGGKRQAIILPEGGGGPVRSRVEWVETAAGSGVFNMVVKNKAGQPYIADDKLGSPMAQLIAELKGTDDHGVAWDASGAGGSSSAGGHGSRGGGDGRTAMPRTEFDGLAPAAQAAHVEAGGTVTD